MAEEKKTRQNASFEELLGALERAEADGNFKASRQLRETLLERFDFTPQERQPNTPEQGMSGFDKALDYAASLGSGVYQGVVGAVDFPANVGELAAQGIEKGYKYLTGTEPSTGFSAGLRSPNFPTTDVPMMKPYAQEFSEKNIPSVYGYEPKTEAGKSLQRVGNFLPMAGRKPIVQGVAPALVSERVKEAEGIKGTNLETPAEIMSAVLTPILAKKIVSPSGGSITGETKKAIDLLKKNGVFPTAAQSTGNRTAAYLEQSSDRGLDLVDAANRNFSRAVLKKIGINSETATPDMLQEAYARIGANLNKTMGKVTGIATKEDFADLSNTLKKYSGQVGPTNRSPVFVKMYRTFRDSAANGTKIDTETLRYFRETLGPMTRRGDEAGRAAREMTDILTDFISRNLGKEGTKVWKEANLQYREFLAIEDVATKAGDALEGIITPHQLRPSLKSVFGKRSMALGKSELGELAKAGSLALKPLPNSGTAFWQKAMGTGGSGSAITAGGLAQYAGLTPEQVGLAAAAGSQVPRVTSWASTTPAGQAYLKNQLIQNLDEASLMRYLAATQGPQLGK